MTHTVIGIFDNQEEARDAMKELLNEGFVQKDIDFSKRNNDTATVATAEKNEGFVDQVGDFFSNLFTDDDYDNYSTVARETAAILTVHVDSEDRAEKAADVLDDNGAINVNERADQYRRQNATATIDNTETMKVPVIEEDLAVGKRTVEKGGVRVRSRVIEKPVKETLRLREEHVVVNRNPVNRKATQADFDNLQEGDIELTERAERAVVGKEARVVGEVEVGKTVSSHEETVSDTVRKTTVDVDEIDTDINAKKANN